jgi:hypothetical protein
MKARTAKALMRVAGALAGVSGVVMLCFGLSPLYHSVTEQDPWMIGLAALLLALPVYLVYVAYLVWFRFSPLAVRHICGTLAFLMLGLVTTLFDPTRDSGTPWRSLAFLGCLLAALMGYRIASERLSRWLFPQSASRVPP